MISNSPSSSSRPITSTSGCSTTSASPWRSTPSSPKAAPWRPSPRCTTKKVARFLGFAAHYRSEAIVALINRYPFDACILALNAADTHNPDSFATHLIPPALEKQMGIIGIKIAARGRILSSWTPPPVAQQQNSWEGVVTTTRPGTLNIREAMRYTLSLPISTVIIGCDNIAQLEENVQIAREFTPLSQAQMTALSNQVAPVARQSLFFHFETRPRDTNSSDSG